MTKKKISIFSLAIIFIIFIFNVYIYNSNNNVNTQIQQTTSSTQSLSNISNFRIDINRMSQSQKLYLLTLKDEYKSEHEFYLNKVYNQINVLYTDGDIDKAQKTELLNSLNEYKTLNNTLVKNISGISITEETENIILSANESQIKLLSKLDSSIDLTKSSIEDQNTLLQNLTDFQANGVHVVSTVITSIISFFLYFLKKYSNPEDVGDFIKCIDHLNDDDNNENKPHSNNNQSIELINEKLLKYEKMLEIINAIYKQNSKLECNLSKCEMIIKDLRKSTNKLIQDSNTCSDVAKNIIDDISEQLTELKILFESLPIYENLLSDLHEIINSSND
ncbi:MAG: hypothetical protein ACRC92_13975 [Peptostreptococcaceae bacterium]